MTDSGTGALFEVGAGGGTWPVGTGAALTAMSGMALAECLGISRTTLQAWEADGLPVTRGDRGVAYSLPDVARWLATERKTRGARTRGAEAQPDGGEDTDGLKRQKLLEEIESKRLTNEKQRLDNLEREREIVRVSALRGEFATAWAVLRERLQAVGDRHDCIPELVDAVEEARRESERIIGEKEAGT